MSFPAESPTVERQPTETLHTETVATVTVAVPASRKILVIDDSVLIREAAKIALGTIGGWQTTTAASGEEGIERALSEHPDAILLDVVMEGMDGIAVAEHLHGIPATSSFPIVLLTAHDQLQDSERFKRLEIAGVITKPFDISGLSREVGTLLGWPA
jgi:two-component system, OmpR family, alkaline phosphatase synthesis response regulator PhoP